jgi:hypothetical protein
MCIVFIVQILKKCNALGMPDFSSRSNHQRTAEEEHGGDSQDTAEAGGREGAQRLRSVIGVLGLGRVRALGLIAEQLLELGLIGWVGVDRGGVVARRGRVCRATDKVGGNALRWTRISKPTLRE